MRHVVLVRSAYGPVWDQRANARRLRLTAGVTARSLASQTTDAFDVAVLLDTHDPLLTDRIKVWEDAVGTARLKVIFWESEGVDFAPWDTGRQRVYTGKMDDFQDRRLEKNRIAATAYKIDWTGRLGLGPVRALMTRLDDDDAFAPTTLARVQAAAAPLRGRWALIHPVGFRVWRGKYTKVRHDKNAMHTLLTPARDTMSVYDYGHTKVRKTVRTIDVDEQAAWLWVRHDDTISGWKKAERPVGAPLRALFDVDWRLLK